MNPEGLVPTVVRTLREKIPRAGYHDRRCLGPLYHSRPRRFNR